jgi:hypothetical protein
MADQLHKRFSDNQVKSLLESYRNKEIGLSYILSILGIRRSRFFDILKSYKKDKENFSIGYSRNKPNNRIDGEVEDDILAELYMDSKLIADKSNTVRGYNYSYIADRLVTRYGHKVSLPTIIDRAKRYGFYDKKKKKKAYEREVLSNYAGELVGHDSSHHRWSPYANKKWYLITTLDDYSRKILYGDFLESESSWSHIEAAEYVCLKYGIPFSYYVDCHWVFRFVQGRDSFWRNHYKVTDEAGPQFKQVLDELSVRFIYALSPQAKRIEHPYRWLQDRIVRTCAREGISDISDAREVLSGEIKRYNSYQIHSTTGEIPDIRFYRAIDDKRSLFREFVLPDPFTSTKDIFALRDIMVVSPYRKIFIRNLQLQVQGVPPRERVALRISPDKDTGLSQIRFWYNKKLVGVQSIRSGELNIPNF